MYPPVRRTRTDSHESGSEGQDDIRQEMMDRDHGRDPRAWPGYPPHFDDVRRQQYFDQKMYPEYEKTEEYRR